MAIAIIAHTVAGSLDGQSVTTSAIDCRGANCIIVGASLNAGSNPVISDSSTNPWRSLSGTTAAANALYSLISYSLSPTVTSTQTFTISGTNTFASIYVLALSSAGGGPDVRNAANTTVNANSLQNGSVTPPQNNEIVITQLGLFTAQAAGQPTIDGGFTIADTFQSTATATGGSLAYLIQTSAAAASPTWSWTTAASAATTAIAAFSQFDLSVMWWKG